MASGNYAGHRALEREFADAFGWPAAIVFSTGYQANLGADLGAGRAGRVPADRRRQPRQHPRCLPAEPATTIRFRHNDRGRPRPAPGAAGRGRQADAGGGREPLQHAAATARRCASSSRSTQRSTAPCSSSTRPIPSACSARRAGHLRRARACWIDVDFIVGTFSKSLGGVGGFCVSRHPDFELLRLGSRPYIFTASPPPPVIAAARAALQRLLAAMTCARSCGSNIDRFNSAVTRLGYRTGSKDPGPVTALVFNERAEAIAHWQGLLDAGIYTNLMVPPATPGRPQHRAHQPVRGAQRRRPLDDHRLPGRAGRAARCPPARGCAPARPNGAAPARSTSLTFAERRAGSCGSR